MERGSDPAREVGGSTLVLVSIWSLTCLFSQVTTKREQLEGVTPVIRLLTNHSRLSLILLSPAPAPFPTPQPSSPNLDVLPFVS